MRERHQTDQTQVKLIGEPGLASTLLVFGVHRVYKTSNFNFTRKLKCFAK